MLMRMTNGIASLALAVATALLAQFYLGSKENHDQAMAQHFWEELNLRFILCSIVGLVGAALWLGVNWLLRKAKFVEEIKLRQTACLLVAGAVSGSLIGAIVFCLL